MSVSQITSSKQEILSKTERVCSVLHPFPLAKANGAYVKVYSTASANANISGE
jgi:hypothetical protein